MKEPHFPDDGIRWRVWCAETAREIADRGRPVLCFVGDSDGMVYPFLREILRAAPKNERLRSLLHSEIIGLYLDAQALPEDEIGLYDAGSRFHLAILSPSGLTPIVTFPVQVGDPEKLIDEVATVLERLLDGWI